MNQLALFSDAPTAPPVAPIIFAELPFSVPEAPEVSRSLWYDADGPSVAGYDISAPHPLWPRVNCHLTARLEIYRWDRERPWGASMHLDLPDDERTAWSVVRRFATQDEAARELADLIVHAERLFLRSLLGERVITPGQRREHAAQAAADCDPTWIAAAEQERSALAIFNAAGFEHSNWRSLWLSHSSARTHALAIRARFVEAFHRDNDWRSFT